MLISNWWSQGSYLQCTLNAPWKPWYVLCVGVVGKECQACVWSDYGATEEGRQTYLLLTKLSNNKFPELLNQNQDWMVFFREIPQQSFI